MKSAACVILFNNGKILGVSRRDDHTKIDFPGGKVDGEESPREAAIRETKEETGIDVTDLVLLYSAEWGGYKQHVFVGEWKGNFDQERIRKEGHVVGWVTEDVIKRGAFAEFNKIIFKKLKNHF